LINVNYENILLFEHRFWLQILGDHARFILNSLSPKETFEVERAEQFVQQFDQLLGQARNQLTDNDLRTLNRSAHQHALEIRNFKLHILQKQLIGNITVELPPTFFNHMVNEVEEYLRILRYGLSGEAPTPFHPVHYHFLWLPDASGHAASLANSLDTVEAKLINQSYEFKDHFDSLYLKAVEIAGYMRTSLKEFPALIQLNHETQIEIYIFQQFLTELEELKLTHRLLGTLMPLIPDHMYREECYYITKLAQISSVEAPECDPTKPRISQ